MTSVSWKPTPPAEALLSWSRPHFRALCFHRDSVADTERVRAPVDVTDDEGRTPLMIAAYLG
jgi:hypothetical protein